MTFQRVLWSKSSLHTTKNRLIVHNCNQNTFICNHILCFTYFCLFKGEKEEDFDKAHFADFPEDSVLPTVFFCAVCDQQSPWKILPFSERLTWKQCHLERYHQLVSYLWSVLLIFLKTLSSTGCDFGTEYSRTAFSNDVSMCRSTVEEICLWRWKTFIIFNIYISTGIDELALQPLYTTFSDGNNCQ